MDDDTRRTWLSQARMGASRRGDASIVLPLEPSLSQGRPMHSRSLRPFFSLILLLVLACCGGSGGGASAVVNCGSQTFCVVRCSLGCAAARCSVTDISPNQTIDFIFNRPLNTASVTSAAFSLRTSSGEPPAGRMFVRDSTISFIPEISSSGGVTEFGFVSGETYTLTVAGGSSASQAITSTSGERLAESISCNLRVSRPLIDPNSRPPSATLLAPTATTGVESNATIVLEFDELIDTSPFQGATTATSPILYRLRKTVGVGVNRQCDPTASPVVLPGIPQTVVNPVTQTVQVVLKPSIALPSGVCVEVEVTSRVTDLSGKPANQVTFRFITKDAGPNAENIVEAFSNSLQLDQNYSSGTWGNNAARPGRIGEDGELGEFNVRNGVEIAPNVFQWDTDNMVFPGSQTVGGQIIVVNDGIYRFSHFHLNPTDTMVFKGANPARFIVRGSAIIEGTIAANAPDTVAFDRSLVPLGQPGGVGVIGGGTGGHGAEAGDGQGNQPQFNGRDGEDVQLPAGHAYGGPTGRQIGTGGKGSPQFPEDGREASILFNGRFGFYSAQIAAGGGGGGGSSPGSNGEALRTSTCVNPPPPPPKCPELGPDGIGGNEIDLLPVPPGLTSTVDHFLVGGSGGGGGGSCPFWSSEPAPPVTTAWWSGGGGAGGGGIVAFRVGGNLTMTNGSGIEVKGGSASANILPPPAPGGGGSGGSCLLQVGAALSMSGLIDSSGGAGGHVDERSIFHVETKGGDGAPGFIRLESPNNPLPSALGATIPAATTENIGPLTDTDVIVGSQSKFYTTGQLFPPTFVRYELQIENNGSLQIYSDDATWLGGQHQGLAGVGSPVRILFQGGEVDPTSGAVDPSSVGPWRQYVGAFGANTSLNNDQATGYRFQILFDRAVSQTAVVKKVTVFFRS